MSDPAKPPADDAAVSAGRGVVFIGAAKIYFMIAGAAIELVLPNLVAPYVYGAYRFVAQSVSTVNNVVVTGTIQAVSRYTTADPARAEEVKATGLKMHLMVGLPLALLFAAIAPLWAWVVHDPGKTGPLALSAAIVCGYAFYAVLVGSANGARQFHKQAGLDVMFSTLKAIGVLGAAFLGFGLYGAMGGWVGAVFVILFIAWLWVGWNRQARPGDTKPMVRYLGGVATYLIVINLIMSVDQFLLKRLSAEWYMEHGYADASMWADAQVGFYGAVQQLSRLPYQLMIAVTFVVFPLVSRSVFENDQEKTRSYIRTTLRYSLIFAGAMGVVMAANPGPLLDVPFDAQYARMGGPALAALALGHVAFAVFTIAGTILNSAGYTRDAVVVAAATLIALVGALIIAIPQFDPGADLLLACGAATGGAMLLGALASGWMLVQRFGAFVPAATAVRVGLATAVTIGAGRLIPATRPLMTLAEAAVCGLLFLGTLVATRELTGADLRAITRVAGRKR